MKMIWILLTFYTLVLANGWELRKDENGIKVFTKEIEGSNYLAYKGESVVEGSMTALVAILYDTENAPSWLEDCTLGFTLDEVHFEENYVFEIYGLPFPLSDRMLIIHSTLIWDAHHARITSVEANDFCNTRSDERCRRVQAVDAVVVTRSRGYYDLQYIDTNHTKVVWEQHVESGGSLPTWLVNTSVVDIPFNSLQRLKLLVQKQKYKNMTRSEIKEAWQATYERHH